jgi:hypothetical protein
MSDFTNRSAMQIGLRRKSKMKALALTVLALLTGACKADETASPSPAQTSPSQTAEATPSPSPAAPSTTAAAPSPAGPLRLSSTAELTGVSVTVLAYREGSSTDRALDIKASEKWASIDVKVCNNSLSPLDASDSYWTLQSAGSVEYEKANYQDFAMPQQPVYGGRTVSANKCTRGWVSFVVQRNEPPALAIYADDNGHAEWNIKR